MAEAVNLVPNVGVNEQAVAGNQGAIFTAADREIIKKRVAEVEGKLSFAERIRNLFSKTDAVDEVRQPQDTALKPNDDFNAIKNEAKIHRHLVKHRQIIPQDRVIISSETARPKDSFKDQEAQLEKVKAYAQSYIQKSSAMRENPRSEKLNLDRFGIDINLKEKLEDALYQDLYQKVREKIDASANGIYLSELIWTLPNAQAMLDVFLPQENVVPESGVKTSKKRIPSFDDLVQIARRLDIDLPAWLKSINYEKVVISQKYLKEEKLKKIKSAVPLLSREFIKLVIQKVLSRGIFKGLRLGFKISSFKNKLLQEGLSREDVHRLERTGRKIAFMKIIVALKELHLRRVFSSTASDFEKCSKEIRYYNSKIGRLGFEISDKGLRWIRKNFEVLAYKVVQYKLSLLKSIQSLGYDKEREGEIKKLEMAILRIRAHMR